jgi:hypothetical protein
VVDFAIDEIADDREAQGVLAPAQREDDQVSSQ